jgi:hypothetical protein
MKTRDGETSSSGKDSVVGAGQESMVASQAGPRSAQPSGPPVDSPAALDDSDANVGGAQNLLGVTTTMFLLVRGLSSMVELLDAQSQN